MYRIDDATAASSLPAPEAAATEGFFTEGNAVAGTPATKVRGSWLNMVQEELVAILAAAGIARSKTSYNQVNAALQKMYAPVVGSVRNLSMSLTAASATATMTADEIVVETSLGGQTFKLASFNKTINLAATGAGGMDIGTAPASGFVALYAIYNPTTATAALLATNVTTAIAPNVYGGANMPAGYTASGLVSVWPTNASKQFPIAYQADRHIDIQPATVLSTSSAAGTLTALSIAGAVPPNAKTADMTIAFTAASSTTFTITLAATPNNLGTFSTSTALTTASIQQAGAQKTITIINQQSIAYSSGSTGSLQLFVVGYSF